MTLTLAMTLVFSELSDIWPDSVALLPIIAVAGRGKMKIRENYYYKIILQLQEKCMSAAGPSPSAHVKLRIHLV